LNSKFRYHISVLRCSLNSGNNMLTYKTLLVVIGQIKFKTFPCFFRIYCVYKLSSAYITIVAVLMMFATSGWVLAKEVTDQYSGPAEERALLEEVVVTGIRHSIVQALDRKRRAVNIVDSIEAEDIGKFPDLNLAESLQRVPGVALERSVTGSGRTITVRGLSSQFSRVEINGMGGATGGGGRSARIDTSTRSAGQDGRNFNFDVLPSELFASAILIKSPQASDSEGGIAALIKLNTPEPFSLAAQYGTISVQGNWGEVSGITPRFSGLLNKHINDQFALLVGVAYSEQESDTAQVGLNRLVQFSTVTNDVANSTQEQLSSLVPLGASYIGRTRETKKYTGLLTWQWRPLTTIDIKCDAIYTHTDGEEEEAENLIDMTQNLPTPTSMNIVDGVARSAEFSGFRRAVTKFRSDSIDDTLQQYTLQAKIKLNDIWQVVPFIGYNQREGSREFNQIDYFSIGGNVRYSLGGGVDDFSTSLTDFRSNPEVFILGDVLNAINENSSKQKDIKIDVIGNFDFENFKQIKWGMRYNDRTAEVSEPFRGALNFSPVGPTLDEIVQLRFLDLDGLSPSKVFSRNNIPGVALGLLAGQDLFFSDFNIDGTQLSGIVIGGADSDSLAMSKVNEETLAVYAEANLIFDEFEINVGLRHVQTDQASTGSKSVDGLVIPVKDDNNYSEVLPALNVRYNLTEQWVLRGAWSKTISRPSLQALSPRETIDFTSLTGSRGNPELEPFVVNQYDLGVEWYFHLEALVGVTLFNKEFDSLIGEETVVLKRNQASTSGSVTIQNVEFSQPLNAGKGSVDGYELIFQTGFFFLPGDFKNAGFIFNYTDLDSQASITSTASSQQQPFPNLSPSSFNMSLYYDNGTFSTRLNYAWREGFLQDGLDPNGNFLHQEDFGQLDITMSYQLNGNSTLQLQMTNLLDEELEYSSTSKKVKISRANFERTVLFGIKYDLNP
jgi:iron complex outermembrane recepter protein